MPHTVYAYSIKGIQIHANSEGKWGYIIENPVETYKLMNPNGRSFGWLTTREKADFFLDLGCAIGTEIEQRKVDFKKGIKTTEQ